MVARPPADPAVSIEALARVLRDVATSTDPAWAQRLARDAVKRFNLGPGHLEAGRPSMVDQAADTARRAMLALRRRPAILPPSGCHAC